MSLKLAIGAEGVLGVHTAICPVEALLPQPPAEDGEDQPGFD